jgi:hypothetical protein
MKPCADQPPVPQNKQTENKLWVDVSIVKLHKNTNHSAPDTWGCDLGQSLWSLTFPFFLPFFYGTEDWKLELHPQLWACTRKGKIGGNGRQEQLSYYHMRPHNFCQQREENIMKKWMNSGVPLFHNKSQRRSFSTMFRNMCWHASSLNWHHGQQSGLCGSLEHNAVS